MKSSHQLVGDAKFQLGFVIYVSNKLQATVRIIYSLHKSSFHNLIILSFRWTDNARLCDCPSVFTETQLI